MTAFREAATLCADRLRIFHKLQLQLQARERGEDRVDLAVDEFFDEKDLATLEAYEKALNEHTGARALPFEDAS